MEIENPPVESTTKEPGSRSRIISSLSISTGHTRWHKPGKRAAMVNRFPARLGRPFAAGSPIPLTLMTGAEAPHQSPSSGLTGARV